MKKSNFIFWILIFTIAVCLCGCSVLTPQPEPTPQPTATPAPTPEPVITYSQPELMPLDNSAEIPEGYTRVTSDALPDTTALFQFTDTHGTLEYRVYGGYDELTDGVQSNTITGFYPSDETGALSADAEMVDPATEPFGSCQAVALDTEAYRLRTAYSATEQTGVVKSVDADHPGYFIYGAFDDGEPKFYPADENGKMIPGALPVEFAITLPSYTPDDPPEADGQLRLVVYIGSQSVVAYRSQGGEWLEERVMICSTGRKKGATPIGDHNLMKQYLYKKLGMNGEGYYGQYSSRIAGNVLFHSVPIDGDDNYNQDVGKKQMKTKYYENLGTNVSGGCVRLRVIDAYWIYTHCEVGTPIRVTDDVGPTPAKPEALIYGEPYTNKKGTLGWDPSDPDPENPYHAIYPPELVLDGPVADKSKPDDANDEAGD